MIKTKYSNKICKHETLYLSYADNFKVTTFEPLQNKIPSLKINVMWTRLLTDQMSFLLFVSYGCSLYCSKSTFLSEAPTSCYKKNADINFGPPCLSICITSKSVSQIFQTLIQTGDIDIFVLRNVISVSNFQIKM